MRTSTLSSPLRSGLARAIAGTTAVNMLSLILTAMTGILLARSLGDAGRGQFAAAMAWYGIALVLGEWGQSAAATYKVAADRHRGDVIVASSVRVMRTPSTAVAVLGLLASPLLANGDPVLTSAMCVMFGSVAVSGHIASYTYGLQAVSIRAWNAVRIVQPLVYLLFVGVLFLTGRLTVVAASLATVVALLFALACGYGSARIAGLGKARSEREEVSWLRSYGVRQSASAVPSALASNVDKVVLSATVSTATLGHYAVAQTVVGTAGALGTALSAVVFPRLSSSASRSRTRAQSEGRLVLVAALVVGGVAAALALIAAWAIPLLYGPSFDDSVSLVWWFVPVAALQSASLLAGTILRGRALPGRAAWAQIVGLAVSLLVMPMAIPQFGAAGAAIALAVGAAASTGLGLTLWNQRKVE